VDESDAKAEADRLNREHLDRGRFEWVAFARDSATWVVVKNPKRARVDPLKATTEAAPKPPQPEDPSFGPLGDLPGYR
jgi:hypothetical protein